MSLRDRCLKFLNDLRHYTGDETSTMDHLESFVVTEIGRASDERFDDAVPLALYFNSVVDREEFIAAVMEAKPGMISRRWPK